MKKKCNFFSSSPKCPRVPEILLFGELLQLSFTAFSSQEKSGSGLTRHQLISSSRIFFSLQLPSPSHLLRFGCTTFLIWLPQKTKRKSSCENEKLSALITTNQLWDAWQCNCTTMRDGEQSLVSTSHCNNGLSNRDKPSKSAKTACFCHHLLHPEQGIASVAC